MERNEIIEKIRNACIKTIDNEIEMQYGLLEMLVGENKKQDAFEPIEDIGNLITLKGIVENRNFNDRYYKFSDSDLELLLNNSKSITFIAEIFGFKILTYGNNTIKNRMTNYFHIDKK